MARRNLVSDIMNNEENLYTGNLCYYFKKIFESPNASNPYHNFRHMIHVACITYEGAKEMEYPDLTNGNRFRALLIAALFHDYGHSGKMGNDAQEIEHALDGIRNCILEEDKELLPEIEHLIKATEFPHENYDLSEAAKIIRDADLSQTLSDTWMQQTIFGLAEEKGITPLECLQAQIGFLSGIKFNTEWAIEKFSPLILKKIKEVEATLKMLE
jgi:hypothetical protein